MKLITGEQSTLSPTKLYLGIIGIKSSFTTQKSEVFH